MVQQDTLCIDVSLVREENILTLRFAVDRSDVELLGLLPALTPFFMERNLRQHYVGQPISVMLTDEVQTHDAVLDLIIETVQVIRAGLRFDRNSQVETTIDDELSRFLASAAQTEHENQSRNRDSVETRPTPLFPL